MDKPEDTAFGTWHYLSFFKSFMNFYKIYLHNLVNYKYYLLKKIVDCLIYFSFLFDRLNKLMNQNILILNNFIRYFNFVTLSYS